MVCQIKEAINCNVKTVPNGMNVAYIYQGLMEYAIAKMNLSNLGQILVQKLIKIKASEPSKFLPYQLYLNEE